MTEWQKELRKKFKEEEERAYAKFKVWFCYFCAETVIIYLIWKNKFFTKELNWLITIGLLLSFSIVTYYLNRKYKILMPFSLRGQIKREFGLNGTTPVEIIFEPKDKTSQYGGCKFSAIDVRGTIFIWMVTEDGENLLLFTNNWEKFDNKFVAADGIDTNQKNNSDDVLGIIRDIFD